jgi:hypothetical protein
MSFETTFKKNAFSSSHFYIDEQKISIDGKEIPLQNISGFAYYVDQSERMHIKTGKTFLVYIYESGVKKPHKILGMYAFDGGSGNNHFSDIFRSLWRYIGDNQLKELHQKLVNGEEVFLNEYLLVTRKGAHTSIPGLFSMKKLKHFTNWEDIQTVLPGEKTTHAGDMIDYFMVIDTANNKTVGKYHIGWNNVRLFDMYVNWLQENQDHFLELSTINH